MLAVGGCGDDDSAATSTELVRYEITAGVLEFKFGEPQDSVVPIPNSLLVVQANGEATFERGNRGETAFQLDAKDLARLEANLAAVDFEAAEDTLSGTPPKRLPAFSVTHGDIEVDLSDDFFGIADGEGPVVADRMSDLLIDLDRIVRQRPGAT